MAQIDDSFDSDDILWYAEVTTVDSYILAEVYTKENGDTVDLVSSISVDAEIRYSLTVTYVHDRVISSVLTTARLLVQLLNQEFNIPLSKITFTENATHLNFKEE